MRYLLDTNVISEMRKTKPDPNVTSWLASIPKQDLHISVLTIGEIRKGIEKVTSRTKYRDLSRWLEDELQEWFHARIIGIGSEVSNRWGRLCAETPRPLPAIDSLIAASALAHDMTLVTRNVKDFEDVSYLKILNPWRHKIR